MPPSTETLDKLYLEWSQFTGARTAREIEMLAALKLICGDEELAPGGYAVLPVNELRVGLAAIAKAERR